MGKREYHDTATSLECRDETGSPGRLVGVILPAGRVAGDRKEIIVGSGIQTPSQLAWCCCLSIAARQRS